DVPVHVVTPGRETFPGREHVTAHEIQPGPAQDAGNASLQQRQVRAGSNGGDDRTLLDTALEQVEGLIKGARGGRDRVRRIDAFVRHERQVWPETKAAKRPICTGCDGDIISAGESEGVARVTSPYPLIVYVCGDREQFNVRPIEHHGQGAQVIDIAPDIGVKM